jgi:zinc D-Ala-D-Ala dipeptidase
LPVVNNRSALWTKNQVEIESRTPMERLEDLRARPILGQAAARSARQSFRTIRIVPPSDENDLAAAAKYGVQGRNVYAHALNPPYWGAIEGAVDGLWLRPAVGERLAAVNARLAPAGLRVHLFDAWRPKAVQAYFHDVWMPEQLRARKPGLTDAQIAEEASQYWSAPTRDPSAPAPHATGAAVDLTLALASGEHLFMGGVFDDPSPVSHRDHFEGPEPGEWSFSFEEARANRRLLHWAMTEQGFAGHPFEWWHFSYGDQLWAALTGAPAALFGLAKDPI